MQSNMNPEIERQRPVVDAAEQSAEAEIKTFEATIERVLNKMMPKEVDRLVGAKNREFDHIGQAVQAWYSMLFAANIFRQDPEQRNMVRNTLAASLVVLGTIVKYTYALGVRRGQARKKAGAVRRRGRKR